MKRRYIAFFLVLATLSSLYGDSKASTFSKTFGTKEQEIAKSVITTDDGFLIVGQIRHTRDRARSFDMYLLKIDKQGKKIWSRAVGGREDEEAQAVIETDNGYIVVGTTKSFGSDRSSIYATSFLKNGTLDWEKIFYSSDDSYYYGTGIVKTDSGYKIAGWENKMELFNSETYAYIVDIDKNGNQKQLKRYIGEDKDRIHDILKVDDGYILVGETNELEDGGFDAYIIKINESGGLVWEKIYGWEFDDRIHAITSAKDGYILVGSTKSNRDKQSEVYVIKLNKEGKLLWQKTYGGRFDEEGFDVVSADDGFVIAGYSESDTNGREDVYLIKIDEDGKLLWQKNVWW